MAKQAYKGPVDALDLYDAVVSGNAAVQRKGAATPYTSRNGHMFSFLDPSGSMALRLSPEREAAFVDEYHSGPVEQHGSIMRGYVRVPADLLARTAELQPWFDESHDWIATLKPKPTTRRTSSNR